jgi:hypothetical protein
VRIGPLLHQRTSPHRPSLASVRTEHGGHTHTASPLESPGPGPPTPGLTGGLAAGPPAGWGLRQQRQGRPAHTRAQRAALPAMTKQAHRRRAGCRLKAQQRQDRLADTATTLEPCGCHSMLMHVRMKNLSNTRVESSERNQENRRLPDSAELVSFGFLIPEESRSRRPFLSQPRGWPLLLMPLACVPPPWPCSPPRASCCPPPLPLPRGSLWPPQAGLPAPTLRNRGREPRHTHPAGHTNSTQKGISHRHSGGWLHTSV